LQERGKVDAWHGVLRRSDRRGDTSLIGSVVGAYSYRMTQNADGTVASVELTLQATIQSEKHWTLPNVESAIARMRTFYNRAEWLLGDFEIEVGSQTLRAENRSLIATFPVVYPDHIKPKIRKRAAKIVDLAFKKVFSEQASEAA
jgi:hypothetical protein